MLDNNAKSFLIKACLSATFHPLFMSPQLQFIILINFFLPIPPISWAEYFEAAPSRNSSLSYSHFVVNFLAYSGRNQSFFLFIFEKINLRSRIIASQHFIDIVRNYLRLITCSTKAPLVMIAVLGDENPAWRKANPKGTHIKHTLGSPNFQW